MSRRLLVATNATRGSELAGRLEDGSSFWAKFMGLMGRASLPAGTGLWLPDNNIHMLFMRFAIDAVFVSAPRPDGLRTVVALRRSLPRWRGVVWWVRGARGVLELPVGTIDATRTAVGDAIRIAAGEETVWPTRGRSEIRGGEGRRVTVRR